MGKSIRSKIKKRLRTAKRQRADAMIYTPQTKAHHEALQRVIQGRSFTLSTPKNAFKYPDAKGAAFPQHQVMKPIDYRAQNLPMAGLAFRGNRRKYNTEEQEHLNNIIKNEHPKMEVLAGGGAILASTKQRVSEHEAELLATAAERPEVAAVAAMAVAPSSSSASAPPVAEEAGSAKVASGGDVDMDPENEIDHSRPPVLKDERRAKRTAEHRPRPNTVKKKTKAKIYAQLDESRAPPAKANQSSTDQSAAVPAAPPAQTAPEAIVATSTVPAQTLAPAGVESEVSKKKKKLVRKKKLASKRADAA